MAHVVLIVEDDDDVRENLALLLQLRGYEVETARHGKQALEKITSGRPPCLIILDLMMPVMNGWELWAELQKDPGLASVPVVLLSAMADVNEEAKSLDAVDYLSKPIDLTKLYGVVSAYC